jgi:hypothetical protein
VRLTLRSLPATKLPPPELLTTGGGLPAVTAAAAASSPVAAAAAAGTEPPVALAMRVQAPLSAPDAELLNGMWCILTPALMLGRSRVLPLAPGAVAGNAIAVALLLLRAMLSAESMCSLDWKRP